MPFLTLIAARQAVDKGGLIAGGQIVAEFAGAAKPIRANHRTTLGR